MCSTAGMGSTAGSNPYRWQSGTTATTPATTTTTPYYVELPAQPMPGDLITIHFDGIKWTETRHIPRETAIANSLNPNHSGFSLAEIEEARQFMADCGV